MNRLFVLSCIVCSALIFSSTAFSAQQVNRVVAKVGDEVITSMELDRYLTPVIRQLSDAYSGPELNMRIVQAQRAALKQLIERKLLTAEANKLELEIPTVEVDKQMDKVRSGFATEEDFRAFLEDEGLTLGKMRDIVKDDLVARVLVQEKVAKHITVLPSQIHDYYQTHVSDYMQPGYVNMYQILIKKEPTEEEGRARAQKVLEELQKGGSFTQLAKMYSEGPKKNVGGEWGVVEEGFFGEDMIDVEKAAFALAPGNYSSVIDTRYGFHIVYIDRKRISRILTEREAYDDIHNRLFEQKFANAYDEYIQYLKDKTYVEIMDERKEPQFSLTNQDNSGESRERMPFERLPDVGDMPSDDGVKTDTDSNSF